MFSAGRRKRSTSLNAPLVKSNWFKADLLTAFAWCHEREGRTEAKRLALCVRDLLRLIQSHPELGPLRTIAGVRIRTYPLRRFPYILYWDYDGEKVILAAFLHASRDREAIFHERHPWF
jgi:plasmid stabilization system protein ParE